MRLFAYAFEDTYLSLFLLRVCWQSSFLLASSWIDITHST